jgi:hypothetical protein
MYKVTAHPDWEHEIGHEAQIRLRRNNERLVEGSDKVVMSPFKSVSDEEIVAFVEGTFDSGLYSDTLVDIENSNLSKLGPRSIAKPWSERRESLVAYFSDIQAYTKSEFIQRVLELKTRYKIESRLHPVGDQIVLQSFDAAKAGSLPLMLKKRAYIQDQIKDEEADKWPAVVYTRTQEGGKTRNVLGTSYADQFREMRYFIAFLKVEKLVEWRSAITTPDGVDQSISHMINSMWEGESIICLDFSAYDSSVGPNHSGSSFAYIAAHFAKAHWDEIYDVYYRFCSVPFYTPDGEYSGFHGVPSGSVFTNTVDSIAQFLILTERQSLVSGSDSIQIQGDDGIFRAPNENVDAIFSSFEQAGFNVNHDKSDIFSTKEGHFLQRYYNPIYRGKVSDMGGVYSIGRALLRIKYLEKFIDGIGPEEDITGDDYFALRTISILENCKHHPHFRDIVNFVKDRDRSALQYSENAIVKFENHSSRRTNREVTNQYGDQGGIESFETVKLLAA